MAYIITDACTKDALCAEACPNESIHPTEGEDGFEEVTQLFINPEECIDCGACIEECPADAIFAEDELPEDKAEFVEKNAAYFN